MRGSLKLSEARERTPRVNAVDAMREQLQVALFGAVTENDVTGMAAKLKEMALAGDLKAMKLFFQLVTEAKAPPAQITYIQQAVVELQTTMTRLQDAIVLTAQRLPSAPVPMLESVTVGESNGNGRHDE